MRVLVTGSRTWDDWETIQKALLEVLRVTRGPVTIVHGYCPHGADLMVDIIAQHWEWQIERHPADWERYGKRAGFLRNIEMVKAGADVCLAFIKDSSRGATHCADAAERAGIPTRRYAA